MFKPLAELAGIHYGKSPAAVLVEESEVPVVGTGGAYCRAVRPMFPGPAIVVPRKGSLGKPHFLDGPFWPSDTTFAVVANRGVNTKWLYYLLANFDLSRLNEATGVPSISRDWLRKIPFCTPPQSEQERIAAILSTVDSTIERTEALIAKRRLLKIGLMHTWLTRGILPDGSLRPPPSIAPELYGETPIGPLPTGWTCEPLLDLLSSVPNAMRSGPFGSALLKAELVEEGVPFLGIDNIFPEKFVANYRRFLSPEKYVSLARYAVRPDDVIITIMGTVGRCCVAPSDLGDALSSKHLWTMTFDKGKVLPALVSWQLNHAVWVKRWFDRHAQGAVMDAIQSSTLKTLKLPVPPLAEQEIIADRYRTLSASISAEEDTLKKLQQQRQGLMRDLLTGLVGLERPAT